MCVFYFISIFPFLHLTAYLGKMFCHIHLILVCPHLNRIFDCINKYVWMYGSIRSKTIICALYIDYGFEFDETEGEKKKFFLLLQLRSLKVLFSSAFCCYLLADYPQGTSLTSLYYCVLCTFELSAAKPSSPRRHTIKLKLKNQVEVNSVCECAKPQVPSFHTQII